MFQFLSSKSSDSDTSYQTEDRPKNMSGRRDARFIDTSLPTLPSGGISATEWYNLIQPYYPTYYSGNLQTEVKSRLFEFGVHPDQLIPTSAGGSIRLNLNDLNGLSEAILTLFSLGHPLHSGPLFYQYFNSQTRNTIGKRMAFSNYSYKLEYCLIDRIHKSSSVSSGQLYRGMDVPFSYKSGSKFQFQQYTSTTVNIDVAQQFLKPNGTLFEIRGAKGLSMSRYSQFPHENEFLVHPFQQFTVNSVQQYGNKTWVTLTGS